MRNLQHLATMVLCCQEPYARFQLDDGDGFEVVLHHAAATAATAAILHTHRISLDCPRNLRPPPPLVVTANNSSIHESAI